MGFILTISVALLTHPCTSVPIIVYVLVVERTAITDEPVVELKPVAGAQI